jgi:hypothetical protein
MLTYTQVPLSSLFDLPRAELKFRVPTLSLLFLYWRENLHLIGVPARLPLVTRDGYALLVGNSRRRDASEASQ